VLVVGSFWGWTACFRAGGRAAPFDVSDWNSLFPSAPIIVELIWVSVSARIQFGGNIIAYPDAGVRLAISRAIAEETPRGPQITKEKRQKGPLRRLRLTRPIADRLSGHAVTRLSPDFAFIGFGSAKAPPF
jgi:hypothetical protein